MSNWLIPTRHPLPVYVPPPEPKETKPTQCPPRRKHCENCGKELKGVQRKWCHDSCRKSAWRKIPVAPPIPIDLTGRCHWCGFPLPEGSYKNKLFCCEQCRKCHASLYQYKRKTK